MHLRTDNLFDSLSIIYYLSILYAFVLGTYIIHLYICIYIYYTKRFKIPLIYVFSKVYCSFSRKNGF